MEKRIAYVSNAMDQTGTAICQASYFHGRRVLASCDCDRMRGDRWIASQKAIGFDFTVIQGGISTWDAAYSTSEIICRKVGNVDVLINNCCPSVKLSSPQMRQSEWHSVLGGNLTAMFHTTRHLVRGLLKIRWRRITNAGSGWSVRVAADRNVNLETIALIGITRSLSKELSSHGIAVNPVACLVDPGNMRRHRNAIEAGAHRAWIASEEATFFTGVHRNVGRGVYMD